MKIDRAFVKDAENDQYSRAICRSVAALADSLHMNVIGEGVETLGQAEFLRDDRLPRVTRLSFWASSLCMGLYDHLREGGRLAGVAVT